MRRVALVVLLAALALAAPASAAIRVQAIPALEGLRFAYDGQTLETDSTGRVLVPAGSRRELRARLRVLPTTVKHAMHAHFLGWRHNRVTLEIRYQVRVLFQDLKGRHVAPGRIETARLSGPAGRRATVAVGQPQWLAGNRIVSLGRRPVSRPINWAVEHVTVDGANVVARAQQRFLPTRQRHPRVRLRFYRLRFAAKDALLGSAIGSKISLTYPDGRTERHPLGPGGHFNFGSLPSGSYTVAVSAPGFASTWPVTVSRDQALSVSIISYLDVLIVLGALLSVAVGLLLVGRRRSRREVAA